MGVQEEFTPPSDGRSLGHSAYAHWRSVHGISAECGNFVRRNEIMSYLDFIQMAIEWFNALPEFLLTTWSWQAAGGLGCEVIHSGIMDLEEFRRKLAYQISVRAAGNSFPHPLLPEISAKLQTTKASETSPLSVPDLGRAL